MIYREYYLRGINTPMFNINQVYSQGSTLHLLVFNKVQTIL